MDSLAIIRILKGNWRSGNGHVRIRFGTKSSLSVVPFPINCIIECRTPFVENLCGATFYAINWSDRTNFNRILDGVHGATFEHETIATRCRHRQENTENPFYIVEGSLMSMNRCARAARCFSHSVRILLLVSRTCRCCRLTQHFDSSNECSRVTPNTPWIPLTGFVAHSVGATGISIIIRSNKLIDEPIRLFVSQFGLNVSLSPSLPCSLVPFVCNRKICEGTQ